jgi:hypothetical protein
MTSPARIPARAAALACSTPATTAPLRPDGKASCLPICGVRSRRVQSLCPEARRAALHSYSDGHGNRQRNGGHEPDSDVVPLVHRSAPSTSGDDPCDTATERANTIPASHLRAAPNRAALGSSAAVASSFSFESKHEQDMTTYLESRDFTAVLDGGASRIAARAAHAGDTARDPVSGASSRFARVIVTIAMHHPPGYGCSART